MPTVVSLVNGVLRIAGDANPDLVSVQCTLDGVVVTSASDGVKTQTFPRNDVNLISFNGGGGDDNFTNISTIPVIAKGGRGNDVLKGGSGGDRLLGGDGDDSLVGAGGNDIMLGEAGQDSLIGGLGGDVLIGGANDIVTIDGKPVRLGDTLDGGDGDDILVGDFRADIDAGLNQVAPPFTTDFGNDLLLGGFGCDRLFGGRGEDVLDAEPMLTGYRVLFPQAGAAFGSTTIKVACDQLYGGLDGNKDTFVRPQDATSQQVLIWDREVNELVLDAVPAPSLPEVFYPPFGAVPLPLSIAAGGGQQGFAVVIPIEC